MIDQKVGRGIFIYHAFCLLQESHKSVRTSSKLFKYPFFFRRFYLSAIKNSISLYGQQDHVKTSDISEIETTSNARKRRKSTIVRNARIELASSAWEALILP